MTINFVNQDHVHCLLDLPNDLTVQTLMKLLKGASSCWINREQLVPQHFFWGRGYGAFSVSQSKVHIVSRYIATQELHHRKKTFQEELKEFGERYGLRWTEEDFVREDDMEYGDFSREIEGL